MPVVGSASPSSEFLGGAAQDGERGAQFVRGVGDHGPAQFVLALQGACHPGQGPRRPAPVPQGRGAASTPRPGRRAQQPRPRRPARSAAGWYAVTPAARRRRRTARPAARQRRQPARWHRGPARQVSGQPRVSSISTVPTCRPSAITGTRAAPATGVAVAAAAGPGVAPGFAAAAGAATWGRRGNVVTFVMAVRRCRAVLAVIHTRRVRAARFVAGFAGLACGPG